MYGPPRAAKKNSQRKHSLRKCIRPLVGAVAPGHDDDARASLLLTSAVTADPLSLQVFRRAVGLLFRRVFFSADFVGTLRQAAMAGAVRNSLPLDSTAQAMRASLFASATMTLLRGARSSNSRAH